MDVKKLTDTLTVRLYPDTLALLAKACNHIQSDKETEGAAFAALAAAFTAAAFSCELYGRIVRSAEVDAELDAILAATRGGIHS